MKKAKLALIGALFLALGATVAAPTASARSHVHFYLGAQPYYYEPAPNPYYYYPPAPGYYYNSPGFSFGWYGHGQWHHDHWRH
jgi:ABC-type oligopeptide transport system substrate-binding subunit